MRLSIASVVKRGDGTPPQGTVQLTSPQAFTDFPLKADPTVLRAFLLRDGKIVGGQDLPDRPFDASLPIADIGPNNPYEGAVDFHTVQPCDPLTWPSIWASPSQFQVVVVSSELWSDVRHHTSPDDPLLIARTALPGG